MHLKRAHIFEWVRGAFAAAFGLNEGNLPPLIFQRETDSVWKQIGMPLESVPKDRWVCFEKLVVPKDVSLDGRKTAIERNDAASFRLQMYALHRLSIVPLSRHAPVRITLLRKTANRRIVNHESLLTLLKLYGEVEEYEFTEKSSLKEQLEVMSRTSILVSCHTSGLANAIFLPPGSAVIELIHRNWLWDNLDQSFYIQTQSLGDIYHFAWRARHASEGVYMDPNDERRFGSQDWSDEKVRTYGHMFRGLQLASSTKYASITFLGTSIAV